MLLEGTIQNGTVVFDPAETPPAEGTRVSVTTDLPIQRTPGVCGGEACVRGKRIPVWYLVLVRRGGRTDEDLLASYPSLTGKDISAAWEYARINDSEVERAIWLNDTVMNFGPGMTVPEDIIRRGRELGFSERAIRDAVELATSENVPTRRAG